MLRRDEAAACATGEPSLDAKREEMDPTNQIGFSHWVHIVDRSDTNGARYTASATRRSYLGVGVATIVRRLTRRPQGLSKKPQVRHQASLVQFGSPSRSGHERWSPATSVHRRHASPAHRTVIVDVGESDFR